MGRGLALRSRTLRHRGTKEGLPVETDTKADGSVAKTAPPEWSNASGKLRKKKKKQKMKKSSMGEALENGLEDIDSTLERIEDSGDLNRLGPAPLSSRKHVL
ncbi:Transcription factor 25 [Saguinus oedipus]|uniref:Transcription factor 25 n=1 Tax=Saguinus oedipus TaxID=9490 RepID=A0ABQ9TH76_SAGOE|nr:Transcription factor 25 [Saguinus oedipus]